MKTKKRSRLMVIFLSFLVCMSLMPIMTFAGGIPEPEINNAGNLPYAVEGKAYEYTFQATAEGTVTWEKEGDWPSWLQLDSNTGRIHGTPNSPNSVSTFIKVNCVGSDGVKRSNSKYFDIHVYPMPEIVAKKGTTGTYAEISGTNLPDATQNSEYLGADEIVFDYKFAPNGETYFTINGVPDGMKVKNFGTYISLDGTPVNAETYSIKVTLSTYVDDERTELIGKTEKTFTLKVNPDGSTPQEEVTISFDKNGGSGSMDAVTVNKGSNYTLPDCTFTAPAGKEFKAWEVNGDEKAPNDSITVNANTSVKALWKQKQPVTYTVSFDKNGGDGSMADVTKNAGETYKLPECGFTAPAGKEFKAWEVDGVEKAPNDSITVNANTTVKAIWKQKLPVTYTVSFDKNGGDGSMPDVTKNAGETYVLPECGFTAPTGKEFKTWEVGGAEKAVGDNITVNANTTVKPIWKDKPVVTYTVTFEKNGGGGTMADVTKNAGETFVLPTCTFTPPAGKEFKAWEVGGVEKAPNDSITVNANTTVKAIWKAKTVTPVEKVKVTFDNNGGSGSMTDATVDKGSSYKLPACAFTAPTGKEFKAWEVGGVEKAPNDSITVNANTTVKAIWKAKTVTPVEKVKVTFDNNGGSGSMADVTVNKDTNYTLPECGFTAPAGKEFKAWEVNGDSKAVGDSITVNADTTVKAIWKSKTVIVNTSVMTIKPDGGKWADGTTTPKTYTVEVGKYFTLPEAPIKDGYTFLYWQGSKYNPGEQYLVTELDHTFTAVWQKNEVKPDNKGITSSVNTKKVDKTSPKTGDNGMMYVYALELLMAASGMLILNARRNKNNLK